MRKKKTSTSEKSIKQYTQSPAPSLSELIKEQSRLAEEMKKLAAEHLKAVNQYLDQFEERRERQRKERVDAFITKHHSILINEFQEANTCTNCPNNFQCPMLSMSDVYRKYACPIRQLPLHRSYISYPSRHLLTLPEEHPAWTQRLRRFLDSHCQ